jgi:hypothetical protein
MSVEVVLCRISRDEFDLMKKAGVSAFLDDPSSAEKWNLWLKLDEFMLAFLSHEDPIHETLHKAVMGGGMFSESLLREDVPRYFTPEEVQVLSQALESVTEGGLRSRFEGLRQIFGGIAMGLPGATDEDAFNYLLKRYEEVQRYYREASQNQDVMLLVLY